MLVLTRKAEDGLHLFVPPRSCSTIIQVKVVRLLGNSVRLGVDAPSCVRVLRSELPITQAAIDEIMAQVAADDTELVTAAMLPLADTDPPGQATG
jgi:carbon storage regulator CsrA